MRIVAVLLLFACAGAALAADAAALAASMREARRSEGFEVRLSASAVEPDGSRSAPVRLAVVGRFDGARQRLSIRAIAPADVHDRVVAAERGDDGRIRAVARARPGGAVTAADPFAAVPDAGVVPWDLFGLWWSWPQQSLGGTARVGGRECTVVRSRAGDGSPIAEVVSCVDPQARLSLRTELFDARHRLLRTITVTQVMRRESGAAAAKRMSIAAAGQPVVEVEAYGGDEHYRIEPDTFAVLDAPAVAGN